MPRPTKWRRVAFIPEIRYFKPAGMPLRNLKEVCLSLEEAESIRLKDLERLEQEQCAEKMHNSRSTFHRVLVSARQKVAEALLGGKAIRIKGGNFKLAQHRFRYLWNSTLRSTNDSGARTGFSETAGSYGKRTAGRH